MTDALKLLVFMSVSSGLLATVLFLVKPLVKNKFPKSWQYYIWLIVILRFLLPHSPQVNLLEIAENYTSNFISEKPAELHVFTENVLLKGMQQTTQETVTAQFQAANYIKIAADNSLLIWFLIALILLVKKIAAYKSFVCYVKAGCRLIHDKSTITLFYNACKERGVKKPPEIYVNKLISSPMLIGIFKPFIVVPQINLPDENLQYIFLHELTHLRKFDIFYKWFVQLTVCIHWFNPVIYFVSKEVNKACEFSCDESVLTLLKGKNKKAYGDTLISALEMSGDYQSQIISVTLCQDALLLKSRLKEISNFTYKSKTMVSSSILIAIIILFASFYIGIYPVDAAEHYTDHMLTKSEVDKCALGIMDRTGNWRYVEPLLPYMTSAGIENIITLRNQKSGNYEQTKSDDEYIHNDNDVLEIEAAQKTDKTYETLAYYLINETEDLYSSIAIFEFMNTSDIDKLTVDYFDKTKEIYKLNDVYPYMSKKAIEQTISIYINNGGDITNIENMKFFIGEDFRHFK